MIFRTTILGALGLGALAGCGSGGTAQAGAPSAKVDGAELTLPSDAPQLAYVASTEAKAAAGHAITAYARLAWDESATVRVYSPLLGRVQELAVEIGAAVKAGDRLVTISSADWGQAQADLVNARTALHVADRALDRAKALFAHGAIAEKDLEAAQADHERAVAEQSRTERRLATYGGKAGTLDQAIELTAPISGIIVEKNVVAGQEVRPDAQLANDPSLSAPLFVVSDPHHLTAYIDLPEAVTSSLKSGDHVQILVRQHPDHPYDGTISFINLALDPQTRVARARARVDNPDLVLRAEMYVTCRIDAAAATGCEVPQKSVFLDGEKHYVIKDAGHGHYVKTAVTVASEGADEVVLGSGVAPGERVVTVGALLLNDLITGT